jgi:hypothetical protein
MDPQIVRDHVAEVAPRSYPELVAATFAAYARWRNKERWGDKTPGYATYMPYLQRMFPNALFVHMIRDGREVAASLPEHKWGPRTAVGGAYWWRTKVRKARRDGARLKPGTYLEVRLDELIERPEVTVSLVCEFLAEPYEAEMLDYPDRYKGKEMDRGTRHLMKPPTAGLREWRRGLTKLDQRAVEAVCRPLLRELGYDAAPFDPVAGAYARLQRIRELIVSAPTAVSMRLRPSTRSY